MSSNLESSCSSSVSTCHKEGQNNVIVFDDRPGSPKDKAGVVRTNAVSSWGLEISPGTSVPDLAVEVCLLAGMGVFSLSFSPFLAGVDGTFNGSAEDCMLRSLVRGQKFTFRALPSFHGSLNNHVRASHWPVVIIAPNKQTLSHGKKVLNELTKVCYTSLSSELF